MTNRLEDQSSPYLLQHKNNPVQWQPWDRQALDMAVQQDKPIFLSIGYSACHWCHVMEHESFENDSIAQVLNDNFINIKVDREERPDLDQIYMAAVMALRNGQGGWPLSVFLTPQQEVFFGGTYWPPTSRMGMPGFDHVLHSVLDAFTNRRGEVNNQSSQITAWLNRTEEAGENSLEMNSELLHNAAATLHNNFDFDNGGFGSAPKFPHTMDLSLLVRLSRNWPTDASVDRDVLLDMVRVNLKKMAYGGIFDHLAGGFARYSVDEQWLVPHFEKMLYDNALLVGVYLDMFQDTGDQFYAMIARKTLDYLVNYMTDAEGGFHSTEDADSEGVEGKFYVWSKTEIIDALGQETGKLFCDLYNVTESGNFEGSNILNMTLSYQQFADKHALRKEDLRNQMRSARKQLLGIRDQRIRPGKDDKILISWNALAISSFARAANLLNEKKYYQAAVRATQFIFEKMKKPDGRLHHTWRNGTAKIDGYLDDYSYLINALLDLYDADFDKKWIAKSVTLAEAMIEIFGDQDGGFFFTASDQEQLIARMKSYQDSSVPSGNSMAALGLLRLGRMTGRTEWIELAHNTILASSQLIQRSVLASGQMLITLNEFLSEPAQFVVIAKTHADLENIQNQYSANSATNSNLICQLDGDKPIGVLELTLAGKTMIDNETTLYVCHGIQCDPPIIGQEAIIERISGDG